jgi:hypothetical protein
MLCNSMHMWCCPAICMSSCFRCVIYLVILAPAVGWPFFNGGVFTPCYSCVLFSQQILRVRDINEVQCGGH